MATTRELFVFVKQHFNLSLEKNELWSRLATELDLSKNNPNTLSQFLIYTYPRLAQKYPDLAPLTDALFMHLTDHTIKIAKHQTMLGLDMKQLFSSWTQCGTRDVPNEYAAKLAPNLNVLLSGNSFHKCFSEAMVCQSPELWSLLKEDIFEFHDNFTMLIYKYEPQRKDLHNFKHGHIVDFYEFMCGINLNTKPTLHSLKNSLKGPHHNSLAWHTALAVCAPEDPTIAGNWMKMSETFSSLRLEPKDPDAWQFWHFLRECVKDDASGQELLSCLSETQNEMASAFANGWSIVDALYESDMRYAQAAKMHCTAPAQLCIPSLCANPLEL